MFAGGDTVEAHLENLKLNPLATLGPHLVVGPMYHTGPLSGARLLAAGAPSVILTKFDAENTLKAIAEFKTTSTIMVPTHFVRLLALDPDAFSIRWYKALFGLCSAVDDSASTMCHNKWMTGAGRSLYYAVCSTVLAWR